MNVFDIFKRPEFSAPALTESINITPNKYGLLDELGLFPHQGKTTTYVELEFKEGHISLLPTRERGAPPTEARGKNRYKRQIPMFHIPHSDFVYADDIQNALQFGSNKAVENVGMVVNEKLEDMGDRHRITHEFMRWGALSGIILDADGSTLLDIWQEFGVTRVPINFMLNVATTDIGQKSRDLKRRIEKNLKGEFSRGTLVLCSPEFFDKLIVHENVKAAYDKYSSRQEPLREDLRRSFVHQGLEYREHVGEATFHQADGTEITRRFIPSGEAIAVPLGTRKVFRHYSAPADRISTINKMGKEIYSWQYKDKKDRFIELESQSNPLIICQRPDLIIPVLSE